MNPATSEGAGQEEGFPIPSWPVFFGLRVIREGVNGLLPVAQIGGHLVGARLLAKGGVPLGIAGASVAVDLTLEMLSQVVFTLLGVGLLAAGPGAVGMSSRMTGGILAVLALLTAIFVLASASACFACWKPPSSALHSGRTGRGCRIWPGCIWPWSRSTARRAG